LVPKEKRELAKLSRYAVAASQATSRSVTGATRVLASTRKKVYTPPAGKTELHALTPDR
jgi:hypothetical protein